MTPDWALVTGRKAWRGFYFFCAHHSLWSLLLPFSEIFVLFTDVEKNGKETVVTYVLSLFNLQFQVSFEKVGLEKKKYLSIHPSSVSFFYYCLWLLWFLQIFGLGWVSVSCWLKLQLLPCVSYGRRKNLKCKWNFYFV